MLKRIHCTSYNNLSMLCANARTEIKTRKKKRYLMHLDVLLSMLTPLSQPLTIFIQNKRNWNKCHAQESKQTARPINAQARIHRIREQREPSTKRTAEEIITREHTRRVRRVSIRQVRQHRLKQQQGGDTKHARSDDGHNPVYRLARGPTEPEQTDGHEEAAEHGRLKADLGPDFAAFVELLFLVEVEVEEEAGHRDEGANEDAEEGEAFFAEVEAVDFDEDDGEGLEPDVEEAVDLWG